MIAGPNGSGKTTLTRELLSRRVDLGVYINPDDIAVEMQGSYPERTRAAQAEAARQRSACLASGRSFSFETVMSHPSKVAVLAQARVPVLPGDDEAALAARVLCEEHLLYPAALAEYCRKKGLIFL